MSNKSYVRVLIELFCAVSITFCATAGDTTPTFNLKNKSEYIPTGSIVLVVYPRGDKSAKHMRISHHDKIAYDGQYDPSQPISLRTGHDISYYDLHNLEGLDIFYNQNNVLNVEHVRFKDINKDTMYYVKYRSIVPSPYDDPVEMDMRGLVPQEGVREKLFGKKTKTTDGYSLAHNVTDKNIEKTTGSASKVLAGKLPAIDFEQVDQEFVRLVKEYRELKKK